MASLRPRPYTTVVNRTALLLSAAALALAGAPASAAEQTFRGPYAGAGTAQSCTASCGGSTRALRTGEVDVDFSVNPELPDALCDAACGGSRSSWVTARIPIARAVRSLDITGYLEILARNEPRGVLKGTVGGNVPAAGVRGTSSSEVFATATWPGCGCSLRAVTPLLGWSGTVFGLRRVTLKIRRAIPATTITVTVGVRGVVSGEAIVNGQSYGDTDGARATVHAKVQRIVVR